MAQILILLGAIFAFVFFIQSITVRITYEKEVIINIYFLFFCLVLYPKRKKKTSGNSKNRIKNKTKKIKRMLKNIIPIKRSAEYMLSHSRVTIHSLNIKFKDKTPDKTAINIANINSLINSAAVFVKSNAKDLNIIDSSFAAPGDYQLPALDISFDFSLYHSLLSLLVFIKVKVMRRTA